MAKPSLMYPAEGGPSSVGASAFGFQVMSEPLNIIDSFGGCKNIILAWFIQFFARGLEDCGYIHIYKCVLHALQLT